jgi:hypothetical protein
VRSYSPTPTDVAFVATKARGPAQKLALMILLKVYQRLHYFPDPQTIPRAVIDHIRSIMKLPDDLVPDISPATLYRLGQLASGHSSSPPSGKPGARAIPRSFRRSSSQWKDMSNLWSGHNAFLPPRLIDPVAQRPRLMCSSSRVVAPLTGI